MYTVPNGYFPRELVTEPYRKHLPTSMTFKDTPYVCNQDVAELLNNKHLVRAIRKEIELNATSTNTANEEINTRPSFRRPSQERDYE